MENPSAPCGALALPPQWQALLDANPLAVFVWRRSELGIVLAGCNDAAQRLTGGQAAEHFGRLAEEICSDRPELVRDLHNCLQWRSGFEREAEHALRGRRGLEVLLQYAFVEPDYVLVHVRDHTPLARSERRLRRSRHRLQAVFDNAAIGIGLFDACGRLVRFNQKLRRMLGYSAKELWGMSHLEFTHPADLEISRTRMEGMAAGEIESYRLEKRYLRKDGSVFWGDLSVTPIHRADGGLAAILGVIVDITAGKAAETRLRESEARLRAVFEHAGTGIVVLDFQGSIQSANPAFCRMVGFSGEELRGRRFQDLAHMEDIGSVRDRSSGRVQAVDECQGELRLRCVGGRTLWAGLTATFLRDGQGRPEALICLVEDISARRQAQELREDVERITRHDLKAPLNAMIYIPRMLRRESLTPRQRELAAMVESSAYRMLAMINRSLDLYKMEQGTYLLRAEDMDLLSVLRRVLTELRERIESKRLAVEVRVDGCPPREDGSFPMRGDALLCHGMLANLITNALEASPKGGPLGLVIESLAGEEVSIAIHNLGTVPESIRERFFEKYVTCGKPHGTGLGTYSARLAAETHGGRIACETSEAEGTTVRVLLPRWAGRAE